MAPTEQLDAAKRFVARVASSLPFSGLVTDLVARIRPLGSLAAALMTPDTKIATHKKTDAEAAILFVHGFSATPEITWGTFPASLAATPELGGWDIYSLGYATSIAPDIRGIWAADPSIDELATHLRSRLQLPPLRDYATVALIAHSMGGLVVQKALVDDTDLAIRASHVVLFGTPSGGLMKARWAAFLKSQLRDMGRDGAFISGLRRSWDDRFGSKRPFEFLTVAGDRDVFVPPESSLDPFPRDAQVVVPGNHLDIVRATGTDDMSVQVTVHEIQGDAAPAGPWNSARVAVQHRDFHEAIDLLEPHADELDDRHLVDLALALDATGARDKAIKLLKSRADTDTDVKGTLAGRFKRAWLASGRKDDGETAITLYREAFTDAKKAVDAEQAYYNGINVAFLELAFEGDTERARETADEVLELSLDAKPGTWRSATEAEACLQLGETERALDYYRETVHRSTSPRDLESVYVQARQTAEAAGLDATLPEIDEVFGLAVD